MFFKHALVNIRTTAIFLITKVFDYNLVVLNVINEKNFYLVTICKPSKFRTYFGRITIINTKIIRNWFVSAILSLV